MKEILKFKNLEYEYGLFLDNHELKYKKIVKENIYEDVSNQEKELINKVLFELLPSNNIKDLGYIKYGNKKIKHLYDFSNRFHIFHENENITRECLKLNYLFNNQEDYIYMLKCHKNYMKRSESRYIKRNVKIGKKVISVLTASTFLLAMSIGIIKGASKVEYNNKNNYKEIDLEYSDRKLEISEIINAINNNSNLTREEKDFFLSNFEFFYDNLEYLDYYAVLDNLNHLHIEYIEDECDQIGVYGDFTYNGIDKGRIRIYEASSFKDTKKYALSHEFLHAFTKNYYDYNYIYEAIHVLFNNEYFGKNQILYDSAYEILLKKTYILCELIDEDTLRKYHADNNTNYLVDGLMKIIPNQDMAIKLITDMDAICRIEMKQTQNSDEYYAYQEEILEKEREIEKILKIYYETKYKISIYEDNYIYYLFDSKVGATKIASKLNLSLEAFKLADELTRVKQYKKIFNKTGNDSLILAFCSETKEVIKPYTLESVLNGDTGRLYRNKEEINFKTNENGLYLVPVHEPINYIDYEVLSINEKEVNKTI